MITQRLYISKQADELQLIPDFCAGNELELTAHSFLSFEPIAFEFSAPYDVVFFASPRAAAYFLDTTNLNPKAKIAVAGQQTAAYLQQLGHTVDYLPTHSGSPVTESQTFAQWVQNRHVLFPVSDRSQHSYSRFLDPEKTNILPVYRTIIAPAAITPCTFYVFTSPSNVSGFTQVNTFPVDATIIAWGSSTATALETSGNPAHHTLQDSDESALISLIRAILAS